MTDHVISRQTDINRQINGHNREIDKKKKHVTDRQTVRSRDR